MDDPLTSWDTIAMPNNFEQVFKCIDIKDVFSSLTLNKFSHKAQISFRPVIN